MRNLIPEFINQQIQLNNFSGKLTGSVIFADLKGFTDLTDSLMKKGKLGAEIIAEVINETFSKCIDTVYKYGGYAADFQGDAFTALFHRLENPLYALKAGSEIIRIFQNLKKIKTELGDFEVSIKLGIDYGEFQYHIVHSEDYYAYYYDGSAILGACNQEKKSKINQMSVSSNFSDYLLKLALNETDKEILKKSKNVSNFHYTKEDNLNDVEIITKSTEVHKENLGSNDSSLPSEVEQIGLNQRTAANEKMFSNKESSENNSEFHYMKESNLKDDEIITKSTEVHKEKLGGNDSSLPSEVKQIDSNQGTAANEKMFSNKESSENDSEFHYMKESNLNEDEIKSDSSEIKKEKNNHYKNSKMYNGVKLTFFNDKSELFDLKTQNRKNKIYNHLLFDSEITSQDKKSILENIENINCPETCFNSVDIKISKLFTDDAVLCKESAGEFRDVVNCFIKCSFEKDKISNSIIEVKKLTKKYGGYFNRITFGDKGSFVLVIFGAPYAKEKMALRALQFSSEVQSIDGLKSHIGLSFGRAYAGFTGSDLRAEYTVLSSKTNLAARFMMFAEENEYNLITDYNIYNKGKLKFNFNNIGRIKFKGFKNKISVYSCSLKKRKTKSKKLEEMIGREKELNEILSVINENFSSQSNSILYIDGSPGIGKTRMIEEVLTNYDKSVQKIYMPCSEIISTTFHPVVEFLKDFFNLFDANDLETNKKNFEKAFDSIYKDLKENSDEKREFLRLKSVYAGNLGIKYKDSLFEILAPKNRYENTVSAFMLLFKILLKKRKTILAVDDCQWMDTETQKLFSNLVNQIKNDCFTIIFSGRSGNNSDLFRINKNDDIRINIDSFDLETASAFIKEKFKKITGKNNLCVPENSVEFFYEKSSGNPFYIEQMILFAFEKNIFNSDFTIRFKEIDIPSDIRSIIISRIDKLTENMKSLVKAASVLGFEFSEPVLKEVINEKDIKQYLKLGEEEVLWNAVNEIQYIFQHTLIRESVYGMLLHSQLKRIHLASVEAIKKVYKDNIEAKYYEIGKHFEKAFLFSSSAKNKSEIKEDVIKYYNLALKKASEAFHTIEIEELYNLLLKYDDHYLNKLFYRNKLSTVYDILGKWDKAEETLRKNIEDAVEYREPVREASSRTLYANLLSSKNKIDEAFNQAEKALELFTAAENKKGIVDSKSVLGLLYGKTRQLDKAIQFSKESLKTSLELNLYDIVCKNYNNLGIQYKMRGEMDSALECYKESYKLSNDLNLKHASVMTLNNIGNIYFELGEFGLSYDNFSKAYEIAEEIGYKHALAAVSGNIARIYFRKKNVEKAVDLFKKAYKINSELSYYSGMCLALGNIGNTYKDVSDFEKAEEYYTKALGIAEPNNILHMRGLLYNALAEVRFRLGKKDKAAEMNSQSLEIAEKLKMKSLMFDCLLLKAEILEKEKPSESIKILRKLIEEVNSPFQLNNVYKLLYKLDKSEEIKEKWLEVLEVVYNKTGTSDVLKQIEKLKNS